MLEGIEKARKNLSGDTSAYLEIDNLYQDEALEKDIERNEFEQKINQHVEKLEAFLTCCKTQIDEQQIIIDKIELLGDCSRTPIFEKKLKEKFGKQLMRTMHSKEAIAAGATLVGAVAEGIITGQQAQIYQSKDEGQ